MQTKLSVNRILEMQKEEKIRIFEELLRSTNREGIEKVIAFTNGTDFYSAPASSKFHSNYIGGLLDHSLCVYIFADKYRDMLMGECPEKTNKITDESIVISSLLHDICKTCLYVQGSKWRKDAEDRWVEELVFEVNDTFPIGHGEKSVIMLQNIGLTLTPDEMLAIRYHMGMCDDMNTLLKRAHYSAVSLSPIVPIIQMADYTAANIVEKTIKNK